MNSAKTPAFFRNATGRVLRGEHSGRFAKVDDIHPAVTILLVYADAYGNALSAFERAYLYVPNGRLLDFFRPEGWPGIDEGAAQKEKLAADARKETLSRTSNGNSVSMSDLIGARHKQTDLSSGLDIAGTFSITGRIGREDLLPAPSTFTFEGPKLAASDTPFDPATLKSQPLIFSRPMPPASVGGPAVLAGSCGPEVGGSCTIRTGDAEDLKDATLRSLRRELRNFADDLGQAREKIHALENEKKQLENQLLARQLVLDNLWGALRGFEFAEDEERLD